MWHDSMWTRYPHHLLEQQREIPFVEVEADTPTEIKEKKVRPHILTSYARKKFPMPKYNTNM
jgi:hypothetical protein